MNRLFALSALFLAACTTVSNGPMQRIRVDSDPPGASVSIRHCGAMATKQVTTPAIAWVSRRSTQCEFVFRKPYYEEQRIRLSRHTSRKLESYGTGAEVLLDASDDLAEFAVMGVVLMLPSFAVDAASGSMFELVPNEAFAQLVPKSEDWRTAPQQQ